MAGLGTERSVPFVEDTCPCAWEQVSPIRAWAVLALGEMWKLTGQVICADSTDGGCL